MCTRATKSFGLVVRVALSFCSSHLTYPALRHLLVLRTLFRAVAHKPSLSPVLRVTFRYSGSQALAVGRPQGGGFPSKIIW
jgi:hypothetical protein